MNQIISKTIFLLILLFIFSNQLFSTGKNKFTLVESVPVETMLDQSKLPRAADVWLEMITSAKKNMDIEMFYIANEKAEVLEKILNAIKDAANRGVKIRVIIDEGFYKSNEKSADELEGITNITIKKIPFKKIAKLKGKAKMKYLRKLMHKDIHRH